MQKLISLLETDKISKSELLSVIEYTSTESFSSLNNTNSLMEDNVINLKEENIEYKKSNNIFERVYDLKVFFKRNKNFLIEKECNRKYRMRQLMSKENRECTFKPKINKSFENTQEDFAIRLNNCSHKREVLTRLKFENRKKELEEIQKHCTFQPKIYSINAVSKYKQSRAVKTFNNTSFTFHPKTNKIGRSMSRVREYVKTDACERLSKSITNAQRALKKYNEGYLCKKCYRKVIYKERE